MNADPSTADQLQGSASFIFGLAVGIFVVLRVLSSVRKDKDK